MLNEDTLLNTPIDFVKEYFLEFCEKHKENKAEVTQYKTYYIAWCKYLRWLGSTRNIEQDAGNYSRFQSKNKILKSRPFLFSTQQKEMSITLTRSWSVSSAWFRTFTRRSTFYHLSRLAPLAFPPKPSSISTILNLLQKKQSKSRQQCKQVSWLNRHRREQRC